MLRRVSLPQTIMLRSFVYVAYGLTLTLALGCKSREASQSTYYERKIAPILQQSCSLSPTKSGCHVTADDKGNALGNLSVDSYDKLKLRHDLLLDYGPYGLPALLLKVVPPYQIALTTWQSPTPSIITTSISHVGGPLLDSTSPSFSQLEAWIRNGAALNNAPEKNRTFEQTPCSSSLGTDRLFDANAEPSAADYAIFSQKVAGTLGERCGAGNCHGSVTNSLYLTCGKTEEEKRWNYFAASEYVSSDAPSSEILRRIVPSTLGGSYHEGGTIFSTLEDPAYQALIEWATSKGGPDHVPSDAGLPFFANRVQPMLVKRGCMMLGCHSAAMFHDYRLRGGSSGHFGLPATRLNYQLTLEQLALESPDPNQSRLIQKNLPTPGPGILHRGGPLLAKKTSCSAEELEQARSGPLDQQDPYCVIVAWIQKEREVRMANAEPFSGIVFVRHAPRTSRELPQDFAEYAPGAEVIRAAATLNANGSVEPGAETSLSALCGLAVAQTDARRPSVSWDGKRIAFAARTSETEAYRVHVVDGNRCQVEPTINAPVQSEDGRTIDTNGALVHNFDPSFAPDGRIVFVSTRGNIKNVAAFSYQGPQRSPADPSRYNANLYIAENGKIRQLTFLLNQELTPAFQRDGRVILSAEKRTPGFYQLAARRINLDGGDYHPLFGQRPTLGHNQVTDVVELTNKNFAAIFSEKGASRTAGALGIINRSLGVDHHSAAAEDYTVDPAAIDYPNPSFFQRSLALLDAAATGRLSGTRGAYRNPAPLPNGQVLASYAAQATNLETIAGNFDIVQLDPHTGTKTVLFAGATDELWPTAIYARYSPSIFHSRLDEPNGSTQVVDDERRDRSQVTITDVPLLASLLFQNTRTGRKIAENKPVLNLWEDLPPEAHVKSFADGGNFVTSDTFGQVYVRRQALGSAFIYEDGSAGVLIRGGMPLVLETEVQLAGESRPTLHFQRESMQFYPGEIARQAFRREFFNGLCAGCHGSISGLESQIAVNPDILTQASRTLAKDHAPSDLRTPVGTPSGPQTP